MSAELKTVNPNVCADCERWLEDETPREATAKLLIAQVPAQADVHELSIEVEEVGVQVGQPEHI